MNNQIRNDIYSLNEDELKKIIQQSKKPKTLISTFGWWCGAYVKKLPEILKIKKQYDESVEFILLIAEKDDGKYLFLTNYYLENDFNVNFPTFNISSEFTGGRNKR
ncbi:hypothetical protein ACF3NR_10105 [Vaginella massiliensis]|uniref:hypothetical protein n=1 Tax=Vaginella massiliensis TaxID=1816680 RepID=UPI003752EBB3